MDAFRTAGKRYKPGRPEGIVCELHGGAPRDVKMRGLREWTSREGVTSSPG